MGIPWFISWVGMRYPCISEDVTSKKINEYDNLYLDMNGIIHNNCPHNDYDDDLLQLPERDIFKNIFHHIEVLFQMVRPQKVFFMAVDGVSPRAKLNDIRAGRIVTADFRQKTVDRLQKSDPTITSESVFDHNCISPGTEFMAKLNDQLKYFVFLKISTDPSWRVPKVYFSGHDTPGEGEHKIMEFIRYERSQPGYNVYTKHCFYGVDADIITLSLLTHEPYFSVLRRPGTPDEIRYQLVHISIFRDYLFYEFYPMSERLDFVFNLERVIDDWIFLIFFVGNDFIPRLPDFKTEDNCFEVLFKSYKEVLPKMGGYLVDKGILNINRFHLLMQHLSKVELDIFKDKLAVLKSEGKKGKKCTNDLEYSMASKQEPSSRKKQFDKDELTKLVQQLDEFELSDHDDGDEKTVLEVEFQRHSIHYYKEKFELEDVTDDFLKQLVFKYIEALQWILYYYHSGVPDWSWFYPYHYAPMISDIVRFCSNTQFEFSLNFPFLQFEQLLAVLPACSKNLLPDPYQKLLVDPLSPIIDFYPDEFKIDKDNNKKPWLWVRKLPFINEKRLLDAMVEGNSMLTPEERSRNRHGSLIVCTYTSEHSGVYEAPEYFDTISKNYAKAVEIPPEVMELDRLSIKFGLSEAFDNDLYVNGFPRLNFIDFSIRLENVGFKFYLKPSPNPTFVIVPKDIEHKEDDAIYNIADMVVGKEVWVDWPFLEEAKAVSISDGKIRIKIENNCFITKSLSHTEYTAWKARVQDLKKKKMDRKAIDMGEIKFTVNVVKYVGTRYVYREKKAHLEAKWKEIEYECPLQSLVDKLKVFKPSVPEEMLITDLFTLKSHCFVTKGQYCGCSGEVLSHDENSEACIQLQIKVYSDPEIDMELLSKRSTQLQYYPGFAAAQRAGVSSLIFAKITGVLLLSYGNKKRGGKMNVGLNLKRNKTCKHIPGWTKKDSEGAWLYSQKVVDCVVEYAKKFPELILSIADTSEDNVFDATNIFIGDQDEDKDQSPGELSAGKDNGEKPDMISKKFNELRKWLRDLKCNSIKPMVFGSEVLDAEVVMALEKIYEETPQKFTTVTQLFKPEDLYKPDCSFIALENTEAQYRLFDRVVYTVNKQGSPSGQRGTIIGRIKQKEENQNILFDVMFDKEFIGGSFDITLKPRVYRTSGEHLINVTLNGIHYKERKNEDETGFGHFDNYYGPRTSYPCQSQGNQKYRAPNSTELSDQTRTVQHPSYSYTDKRETKLYKARCLNVGLFNSIVPGMRNRPILPTPAFNTPMTNYQPGVMQRYPQGAVRSNTFPDKRQRQDQASYSLMSPYIPPPLRLTRGKDKQKGATSNSNSYRKQFGNPKASRFSGPSSRSGSTPLRDAETLYPAYKTTSLSAGAGQEIRNKDFQKSTSQLQPKDVYKKRSSENLLQ